MKKKQVGLIFELRGTGASEASLGRADLRPDLSAPDWDVEYEPERTIATLEGALRRAGCEPVRLGSPHQVLVKLAAIAQGNPQIDAVLNIGEGFGSRNREAWAPVLMEMIGLPCLGSDALTLSTSLDKAWCKQRVASAGVPVAPQCVIRELAALDEMDLPGQYPLFVKPCWEGTAKGISAQSRVENEDELRARVQSVLDCYGQPALVEPFLSGAEYTVTVIGNAGVGAGVRALPVLQRALEVNSGIGVHALEGEVPDSSERVDWEHVIPGSLEPGLEKELQRLSVDVYEVLECKDFSRMDFRLDEQEKIWFLEANTLPTFDPEASFGILAELEGRPVEELLAEIFAEGLERIFQGSKQDQGVGEAASND
ncbi:MAG: D-alanine--D-alanine ligase [Deltaproteobacteria bacterium]|nr:D-alanine--D-alanine ligase [Deltaproteobacteria bacterium]